MPTCMMDATRSAQDTVLTPAFSLSLSLFDDRTFMDQKSPEEVFEMFDLDGSGAIDFQEFKECLPKMGVVMSEAKALRFFRNCDIDGGGDIDFDEFKMALYSCDPINGNSIGFQPNSYLAPKDAFDLYDTDQSGAIDEDEFGNAVEYLQLEMTDAKMEKVFNKYDVDNSGTLDYDEFFEIWLSHCDIRAELSQRGIVLPRFYNPLSVREQLRALVRREEYDEARALADARRWHKWQPVEYAMYNVRGRRYISNSKRSHARVRTQQC